MEFGDTCQFNDRNSSFGQIQQRMGVKSGHTVDTHLGKFCYKGLLKNEEGAGEYMHGSKEDCFLKDEKYSLTTNLWICILTRSPGDSYAH